MLVVSESMEKELFSNRANLSLGVLGNNLGVLGLPVSNSGLPGSSKLLDLSLEIKVSLLVPGRSPLIHVGSEVKLTLGGAQTSRVRELAAPVSLLGLEGGGQLINLGLELSLVLISLGLELGHPVSSDSLVVRRSVRLEHFGTLVALESSKEALDGHLGILSELLNLGLDVILGVLGGPCSLGSLHAGLSSSQNLLDLGVGRGNSFRNAGRNVLLSVLEEHALLLAHSGVLVGVDEPSPCLDGIGDILAGEVEQWLDISPGSLVDSLECADKVRHILWGWSRCKGGGGWGNCTIQ
jgi:hypothetical protein